MCSSDLGSAGPDSSGAFSSNGYNLIGDGTGSSGWVSSDLLNLNPQLGPLQNNGGSTDTMTTAFALLTNWPIALAPGMGRAFYRVRVFP